MSLIPALCAHFKPRSVFPALLVLFTAAAAAAQPSTPPTPAATPGAVVIFALPEELKAPPGRPEGADTLARLRYFLDARFLDRFVDSPTGKLAFVKYSEYRKLLARKKEIEDRLARQERQTPPVDALVARASYAVRIEGNQAFVTARFDVVMLAQTGWKLLPLVGGKIAVSGFASPITGAHLVVREMLARPIGRIEPRESTFSILTDAQGAGEVVLDFAVGVMDDGPGRQVSFQVPQVPLSSVDLTLDQRDCIVRVEPAVRVTESPASPRGEPPGRARGGLGGPDERSEGPPISRAPARSASPRGEPEGGLGGRMSEAKGPPSPETPPGSPAQRASPRGAWGAG